jgi:hypothetical protein
MANAFDQSEYAASEPLTLAIGDRWAWRKSLTDYPIALYTLKYEAMLHGNSPARITITATDDGADHIVEVATATTAAYEPGQYSWAAYIVRDSDSERLALTRGTWDIEPDAATDNADPRSFAKKALDDIEDVMHGRTDRGVLASYSIGDRSLAFATLAELIDARDYYRREYRREIQQDRIARGLNSGSSIRVAF